MAKARAKKSVEAKINDIDEAFCGSIRSSSSDEIKEKLIKLDRYENELHGAREDDMDLASKKEALKVANQTYTEPLNAIKLKRSFALKILDEQGG